MARKTYYTVQYAKLGTNGPQTGYFDSRESAYDFYNAGDYRDKPQAHSVSNPDKIKEYDYLVNCTVYDMGDVV